MLVLTRDEERNIASCLASLSFSDDVVVLDSLSTDRTVDLLYGADGSPIAEFSDDTVVASAGEGDQQLWREWELELVEDTSASRDLLDRLAAGDPAG